MHIVLGWEAPWYCPRSKWVFDVFRNTEEMGICILGLSLRWLHSDAAGVTLELALYVF